MLLRLHIKNVALIEEADINFGQGLNILSGETGAGKSMIIDSVNFVLGERSNKDFVRRDTLKAQVEAEFEVRDKGLQKEFEEMGIDVSDDSIIIQRTLSAEGKSTNRINGTSVTAAMLKQLSEGLIDVHGQHEHQSLLNPAKHIDILDSFSSFKIDPIKEDMVIAIKEYKEVIDKIKNISVDEEERQAKIDKLEFKINEIEDAALKEGEEETLDDRKQYLNNIEKVIKNTSRSLELLYSGSDETLSALDQINQAINFLGDLKNIDEKAETMYEDLNIVSSTLEDVVRSLRKYGEEINADPQELDIIEERLDLIYRLKKKYGATVEEILNFQAKLQQELDFIINSQELLKRLNGQKESIFAKIKDNCRLMSSIRKEKAREIEKEIEKQLKELEMKNASFKINVNQKGTFNYKGNDNVEFMISPNLGEELKPLAKIASGGEMSRVMLALKTVVADAEKIDTFIFDEIDTGVSGKTASRVGEKMAAIGKKRQILCITHLPQIAAMADNHFLIEKTVNDSKTVTQVTRLDEAGAVGEISRLMGGRDKDDLVTKAAEQMKNTANTYKMEL